MMANNEEEEEEESDRRSGRSVAFFYNRNFTGRTGLCIFYGRIDFAGQLKRRTVASDKRTHGHTK
jgi:hypothetical protein